MFHLKTFGETIRLSLLLNILLGIGSLAPFKSNKVNKIVETVNLIVSFLMFIYWSAVVGLNAMDCYQPARTDANIQIGAGTFTCVYLSIVVLIIGTKFKRKNMQDIVNAVDKIAEEMDRIGLPKQYWAQYKYQIWSLLIFTAYFAVHETMMLLFIIKPTVPTKKKVLIIIGACLPHNVTMAAQVSFIIWVRYIGSKFRQVNKLLEEMIKALDRPKRRRFLKENDDCLTERGTGNDHRGDLHKIMIAKKCHLALVMVAKRMNKFFGLQLALISLIGIMVLITLLFTLNFIIWNPPPMADVFSQGLPSIILIFIVWMRIVHLHSNCMRTTNEAKAAGLLLCRLYDSSTSRKFRAEVQNFTQQVLQTPLVFSVCGLVDFDRSFLPSMAGSVFAYLFVIVQLASTKWYYRQELAANATDVNDVTIIVDN